jgi:hypothetical protein
MKTLRAITSVLLLCACFCVNAQVPKESLNVGISGAVANSTSDYSLTLFHQIAFGQRRILQFNYGLRSNAILNEDVMKDVKDPAVKLVQTSTTFVSANNVFIGANLNFLTRFGVGFNIDVGGFSAGTTEKAWYDVDMSNGGTTYANEVSTRPSTYNLLKGGSNDLGTLNSEFYVECRFESGVRLRGGVSHLFTELTASGGGLTEEKRVRSMLNLFTIHLSYPLWERTGEEVK